MEFPQTRLRRLRTTAPMRSLVRETHLHPGALVYPLFLCPGEGVRREVKSMPGVYNLSIDEAVKEAEQAASLGLGGLLLFGVPETKDEQGSGAYDANGIMQQGLRALKQTACREEAGADRGCLPVRIHLARSLRSGAAGGRRVPRRQ